MREEVELQEWQIEKIKQGIQQADAGEFASDEEVAKVFARALGSTRLNVGEGLVPSRVGESSE
ncbi:MAG: CopG family ribbon-helix-helix protein, partial [Thermoanaerobaculia bacterium]